MSKNLSAIRATVRQFLKDEFKSGIDLVWEDDELDLHIDDCLAEISEVSPYVVKETLTTTEGSRELDISSIEDLLEIDKLEYTTGNYPRSYRNHERIDADTIEIDTTLTPGDSEDVYLYCNKLHQLDESSSTLTPQIERLVVLGVTAKAAIAKAQSHITKVNVGGTRTPVDMQAWGINQLALYRAGLRKITKPKTYTEYSKD